MPQRITGDQIVTEMDEAYHLKVLETVINKCLDETVSFTEEGYKSLQSNRDNFVWDLATKIYRQSGHKVELILVRDVVNFRIEAIKHQLAEEKKRTTEESYRSTEKKLMAEEAHHFAEETPHFLDKVTDALGKFGGNENKAKVFIKVREIISDQLSVDESEVSLDSHLSNHLGADELDLVELVIALEEEFKIEISEIESENDLGIKSYFSGGSFWSSSSSYPSFKNAGEECIVRNFVDSSIKKF